MRLCVYVGATLLACASIPGCTHVRPYEREYLTRPGMDTAREGLSERFIAHVQDAREGGGGGGESAGGGCGCN